MCTESPGIQIAKPIAAMLMYTTKERNYNSIVIVHQYNGYDVRSKPRRSRCSLNGNCFAYNLEAGIELSTCQAVSDGLSELYITHQTLYSETPPSALRSYGHLAITLIKKVDAVSR